MKVSIVISYKNEMSFLKDCIKSLEEQTIKDFEAIVVCSRTALKDTELIGEMHTSFPLRTFVLPEDKDGVGAAKNEGIRRSMGEYIFFLDCDDYIEPETLETLLEISKEQDLAVCDREKTWHGRDHLYKIREKKSSKHAFAEKVSFGIPETINSYSILTDIKSIGMLVRRDLIIKNQLSFDESYAYYSDIPFVISIMSSTEKAVHIHKHLYIKRLHQDPVNMPSLNQSMQEHTRLIEAMRAYKDAKETMHKKGFPYEAEIDRLFIGYYTNRITAFFVKPGAKKTNKVYNKSKECFPLLLYEAVKKSKRYYRKLIWYSTKNPLDKIKKKIRIHTLKQNFFKKAFNVNKIKQFIYKQFYLKRPIDENTIIFESFFGRNYSDSPKYLFEYICKNIPQRYNCIWVKEKKSLHIPYTAKQVRRDSLKYLKAIATSKYYVTNVRQPMYYIKRDGTIILETWHGTPLKKLGFDIEDALFGSPKYKINFRAQAKQWDYLIAPNEFCSDLFPRCFAYDGKLLNTGYPRNDILYLHQDKRNSIAAEVKKELKLPDNKKIILYAPTWRDDKKLSNKKYDFSLELDLLSMKERIGDEYIIILRLHYLLVDSLDFSDLKGFAYDVSSYDDIARLYLISDLLITDYSSVLFDYANLKRPMLFYTYDLKEYEEELRGFYFNMKELVPGPLLFSTNEVTDAILNLPAIRAEYNDKYEEFHDRFCNRENGRSSRTIIEEIFE